MAKLHQILTPSVLGLVVGAASATFVVYLAQTKGPEPAREAHNAALERRLTDLEEENFTLGSLVNLYQGVFRIPFLEVPAEPDLQDALDVLPFRLGTFMRLANPTD